MTDLICVFCNTTIQPYHLSHRPTFVVSGTGFGVSARYACATCYESRRQGHTTMPPGHPTAALEAPITPTPVSLPTQATLGGFEQAGRGDNESRDETHPLKDMPYNLRWWDWPNPEIQGPLHPNRPKLPIAPKEAVDRADRAYNLLERAKR